MERAPAKTGQSPPAAQNSSYSPSPSFKKVSGLFTSVGHLAAAEAPRLPAARQLQSSGKVGGGLVCVNKNDEDEDNLSDVSLSSSWSWSSNIANIKDRQTGDFGSGDGGDGLFGVNCGPVSDRIKTSLQAAATGLEKTESRPLPKTGSDLKHLDLVGDSDSDGSWDAVSAMSSSSEQDEESNKEDGAVKEQAGEQARDLLLAMIHDNFQKGEAGKSPAQRTDDQEAKKKVPRLLEPSKAPETPADLVGLFVLKEGRLVKVPEVSSSTASYFGSTCGIGKSAKNPLSSSTFPGHSGYPGDHHTSPNLAGPLSETFLEAMAGLNQDLEGVINKDETSAEIFPAGYFQRCDCGKCFGSPTTARSRGCYSCAEMPKTHVPGRSAVRGSNWNRGSAWWAQKKPEESEAGGSFSRMSSSKPTTGGLGSPGDQESEDQAQAPYSTSKTVYDIVQSALRARIAITGADPIRVQSIMNHKHPLLDNSSPFFVLVGFLRLLRINSFSRSHDAIVHENPATLMMTLLAQISDLCDESDVLQTMNTVALALTSPSFFLAPLRNVLVDRYYNHPAGMRNSLLGEVVGVNGECFMPLLAGHDGHLGSSHLHYRSCQKLTELQR